MKPDMFRKPVTILGGLGFPAEVYSVMDAYRNVVEWPTSFGDAVHTTALKACQTALRGEIEARRRAGCSQPSRKSMRFSPPQPQTLVTASSRPPLQRERFECASEIPASH